jgi:diguanylate cyclase (GGDEF)-like protein/PAS domain S-box-containing protein
VYLMLGCAATAVFLVVPGARSGALFNAIGLSSPIVIGLSLRARSTGNRLPWILIGAGQALFVLGDVITYHYDQLFGTELPYPSVGDLFYLSVYPCLIAGILLLVRRRSPGHDREGVIDSLIVAIGVGVLSWVFLIAPYTRDSSLSLLQKLVAVGYPVMDLMLITVAVRLAVGGGKRTPAFYLLLGGLVALFVTDSLYGVMLLHGGYDNTTGYLEAGWAAFYLLLGAAALHPSSTTLTERSSERRTALTKGRLVLLAAVSLIAPVTDAILTMQLASDTPDASAARADDLVVLGSSILLFLLVIARMAGLVHKNEQAAARERALREAGTALVTATNAEEIHAATITAAVTLAGPEAAVRVCEVVASEDGASDGELAVVASIGGRQNTRGTRFPLALLQEWKRQRLLDRDGYLVRTSESVLRDPLALPAEQDGSVLVTPMFIRDVFRGMLVVGTPEVMSMTVADSLQALGSQVALALESAALTQDLLLRRSEARFASLVQHSSDVVAVIDADATVRFASPSSAGVLGFAPEDLAGIRFTELVHPEDKTRVLSFLTRTVEPTGVTMEFRMRTRDGRYRHVETLRTDLLHDPNVEGIVLNTRDISERKLFEEQLAHQAFHDPITNLANRALFHDRVRHAIEWQERDRRPVAVLFMDLDDFKAINDSLGHATGDRLLAEVGERLRRTLRAADTAARLGGDEFAILLEDSGEGIQAADVAERVLRSFDAPFELDGTEVFVRTSVGIAISEGEGEGRTDAEELLRNADVAMYMAKEAGKGRYQLFEPEMHDTALRRLELKADLQRALEHGEFVLHYQPVIELESGRVSGVEALVRWNHPRRGIVPPLEFIPLAEETGLIVPIGRWVLGEAARYAVRLQHRYPMDPPLHMAVNLSARQVARPEIVDEVRAILEETRLDPATLTLEITESVMMSDMERAIGRLHELKSLGVQLAIDDFGTGYSSLNYVRRFPVDILKVDKSFIDGIADGGEPSALTAAVIELAGILNLRPVAEGIERADQLERLLELHCDYGQGFYFSRPLAEDALHRMLDDRAEMQLEADVLARGAEPR